MSFADFKKIIDETGDYLYEVALYNWGEPFLNKEIYRMIELLKAKKIRVTANSNLNVKFTEEEVDNMVKSGLDVLIVSMDGITQKTYAKYRVNGNLELVKKNAKMISDAKKRLGSKKPELIWQFLVNKFNEHEVPHLEGVKRELGFDALWLGRLRCDMDKEIFMSQEERYDNVKDFLPSDRYSRYDQQKKVEKSNVNFCYFLWTTSAINSDGSVSPCCALYNQDYDFGNVFESGQNFRKIWNNENYVESRKIVLGEPTGKKTVCRVCAMHGFIQS
jgi:radical SAM protein with 4Fe4S-binding SPASM domain